MDITLADFVDFNIPFTTYRAIFFKEGTEAYNVFGDFVYGKFLNGAATGGMRIREYSRRLQIDAPRNSNYNKGLKDALRVGLYFKGVRFKDIDILLTYPEMLIADRAPSLRFSAQSL